MQGLRPAAGLIAALIALGTATGAQSPEAGARYSATVVDLDAPPGFVSTPIDILITRWSTSAERERLDAALAEGGQDRLLSLLTQFAPVGRIHTRGSVGWELRYARHEPGGDGRDRALILADRPVSFLEMRERPRSMDYPFLVVELRIGSNDRGDGRLHVGARLGLDRPTGSLVIENFRIQPMTLSDVRRERGK